MKQLIQYIAFAICTCSFWGCINERVNPEIDYSMPATVNLSVDFSDLQIVTPGTKSVGNAIGSMTNVCILFYNPDGTLAMDEAKATPLYHYSTVNSSESVNISKKVAAGVYKVVAVANMGNLVTSSTYKETIQTLAGLKAISLAWNNTNIAANNQMFGFFNTSAENSIDQAIGKNGMNRVAPTSHDAPSLTLSGTSTLYAKLYRSVAKVTVAFNGEKLNRNVFVTIKSIRLGNLPASCPLWEENQNVNNLPAEKSEELTDANFGLVRVSNRGEGESLFPQDAHSQTGHSLFLFENRQGTTPTSGHKDKVLDKKPSGAFIEIEAFYANEETGSNGKIIYRYMLGEDTPGNYDNYNLTRNRHYKVTLMLQKSGKEEPYWRVEYDENPSISLPTEVNISYRHAEKLEIPFTITNPQNIKEVTAKISENPWYDDPKQESTVTSMFENPKYGFLAWSGNPSDNNNFGSKKTILQTLIPIRSTASINQYQLAVQTEALGFLSDFGGSEKADSFTGYNNYSGSRTAKIEVTVTYKDGSNPETAIVKIVQVPRIVNPIAIYRKNNSQKPFKIRLLNASGDEIESYGPWEAYVESGEDWIGIKREKDVSYHTAFTSGETGGPIRFDYKPLSTIAANETRCGVIVVKFSNQKVVHRIYVRQGDAPIAIGSSPSLWSSFNYIGLDQTNIPQFTQSPMEEGAWLRYGNSVGILANNTDNTDGFESSPGIFKMSNGTKSLWNEISTTNTIYAPPGYELPTQADVNNIKNLADYSGFGIGYDDDATETVAFMEESQYTRNTMGRRGIVICDQKGRNLFFPIGKRGHGRRRYGFFTRLFEADLHYANCTSEEGFEYRRPALLGLSKSMGAIYWTAGSEQLSFNYSLSNIESSNKNHNGLNADACFARFIIKK